jgi:hypothetical protein
MGPRSLIEFTDERETLHLLTIGGSILIDFVMNQARDHGDLIRVLGRTTSLDAERHAGHWRGWLVEVLDGNRDILRVSDESFLFAPSALEVTVVLDLFGVLDGQPAWALNFPLQDE